MSSIRVCHSGDRVTHSFQTPAARRDTPAPSEKSCESELPARYIHTAAYVTCPCVYVCLLVLSLSSFSLASDFRASPVVVESCILYCNCANKIRLLLPAQLTAGSRSPQPTISGGQPASQPASAAFSASRAPENHGVGHPCRRRSCSSG